MFLLDEKEEARMIGERMAKETLEKLAQNLNSSEQKCGTCCVFDKGKCFYVAFAGEEPFATTEDSMCSYIPSCWRPKLPNPDAQLKGLREKMDNIAGIDHSELPLSLQSKIDLLELKLKTLTGQLEVEKERANLYEQNNIKLRAKLINIKKEAEV